MDLQKPTRNGNVVSTAAGGAAEALWTHNREFDRSKLHPASLGKNTNFWQSQLSQDTQ